MNLLFKLSFSEKKKEKRSFSDNSLLEYIKKQHIYVY